MRRFARAQSMRGWVMFGLFAAAIVATVLVGLPSLRNGAAPRLAAALGQRNARIVVYQNRSCGCCDEWVQHLRSAGFQLTVDRDSDRDSIRRAYGVGEELFACHTAVADRYVIEGHVPADLIIRLLRERPDIAGLAAPGMPGASPGMGETAEPYEVVAIDHRGKATVYAHR